MDEDDIIEEMFDSEGDKKTLSEINDKKKNLDFGKIINKKKLNKVDLDDIMVE